MRYLYLGRYIIMARQDLMMRRLVRGRGQRQPSRMRNAAAAIMVQGAAAAALHVGFGSGRDAGSAECCLQLWEHCTGCMGAGRVGCDGLERRRHGVPWRKRPRGTLRVMVMVGGLMREE